ncbi:MAG TPA: L-threonylcarbamoyladenylate synthase [Bryobacteraceae bacterium]|nr:L-threonylcarbamoyladenylate synthase [Bryobacteraceae bacterium]
MSFPSNQPLDLAAIRHAATLIREGKLVAFPTETVYGLGANALDARAIEKIFEVKRRPSTCPLIVHVESHQAAPALVSEWPTAAENLAREFWPGPLTLVLPKRECIPDIVTAGLPTVGLRVPANAYALALLVEARLPIAAPSANRFTALSPTTAEHVRKSLGTSVDFILDGGPTQVGIESTVLSLAGGIPRLLRPGMISVEQIEALIGKVEIATAAAEGAHPAPGMHPRHYSPRTRLVLDLPATGRGAYLWLTRPAPATRSVQMPADPASYAAALYETLHRLDDEEFDWIAVELPPDEPAWAGIRDRLRRAAS